MRGTYLVYSYYASVRQMDWLYTGCGQEVEVSHGQEW